MRGQTKGSGITVIERMSYKSEISTYEFTEYGKFLRTKLQTSEGKILGDIIVTYQGNLVKQIVSRSFDPDTEKVYDFFYDKNNRLIAQASSSQEDTIKFFYNDKGRMTKITGYNGQDVEKIYDQNNNVIEEKFIWSNLSGYYDTINYTYTAHSIFEDKSFITPYKKSTSTIIKELKDGQLVREVINTIDRTSTLVTEYTYSGIGILNSKSALCGVTTFEMVSQKRNLSRDVVNNINAILLGDYKSIGWY